ncbi:hypothetical protein [Mycobacterium riyadhense]|uniref:Uncharacterized protein n=2 Tax=Mycobacterium riyadhense TaxID=486698 RepID=A0A1X2DBZ6_9MYCO|nr:hypothetical protein [Mycobacterium riyadhense]ORW85705.1 hypothetical protein AWC22_11860 [Mycobacterium riyadhense]
MSLVTQIAASQRRMAACAAAVCLGISACSTTASPPAAQPATSTSKPVANAVVPPPTQASVLAKDWKSYGGTVYYGCPEEFTLGKSALERVRPKVFDTKTGQLITPAVPTVAAGVEITGAACALSGTADDPKVAYLVASVRSATAYVFDLRSSQPLATRQLQPPVPDLQLSASKNWRLVGAASGVAWMNAFADGHSLKPPRTVVLSNADLSVMWDDPQPGRAWQDVLAFQRNTDVGRASGAELRLPSGEPIFQDNDISSVDGELADGPDRLVKLTRSDGPGIMSTIFFDLNSRSIVKIGDSERLSGDGLGATLADGQLFIDGHASATSQFGVGVWNLRTQRWDFLKNRDEVNKSSISKVAYFGGHLYITNAAGKFSAIALPAGELVTSSWAVRPFGRISGWTLVCRGETSASAGGECREILLVRDQDGHYPGPWF